MVCGKSCLALSSCSAISSPARIATSLAGGCCVAVLTCRDCAGNCGPSPPLSSGGLAVVLRNAGTDDRPGAGGEAGNGRSLRLPVLHRAFHHGLLGSGGMVGGPAS